MPYWFKEIKTKSPTKDHRALPLLFAVWNLLFSNPELSSLFHFEFITYTFNGCNHVDA